MIKQIYKKWKEQDIVLSRLLLIESFFHLFAGIIKQGNKKNSHVKKDLKIYNSILINELGFIKMNHTHTLRV